MNREDIDTMWQQALTESIKDGEQFTRYHFAALVAAAVDEKYRWEIHTCGPTCTKLACVALRNAVAAEREACAMVIQRAGLPSIAEAIRARGKE